MQIFDSITADSLEINDRFIYDDDEVLVTNVSDLGEIILVTVHDEETEIDFDIEFGPFDVIDLVG